MASSRAMATKLIVPGSGIGSNPPLLLLDEPMPDELELLDPEPDEPDPDEPDPDELEPDEELEPELDDPELELELELEEDEELELLELELELLELEVRQQVGQRLVMNDEFETELFTL